MVRHLAENIIRRAAFRLHHWIVTSPCIDVEQQSGEWGRWRINDAPVVDVFVQDAGRVSRLQQRIKECTVAIQALLKSLVETSLDHITDDVVATELEAAAQNTELPACSATRGQEDDRPNDEIGVMVSALAQGFGQRKQPFVSDTGKDRLEDISHAIAAHEKPLLDAFGQRPMAHGESLRASVVLDNSVSYLSGCEVFSGSCCSPVPISS